MMMLTMSKNFLNLKVILMEEVRGHTLNSLVWTTKWMEKFLHNAH